MAREWIVADGIALARSLWPEDTAESWDRAGFLSGNPRRALRRVMFAVDPTIEVVEEAAAWCADLLVVHHPLLLRGVHTVAEDTDKGAVIARLIRSDLALYAAHTSADQPEGGVSDVFARRLGLRDAVAIEPAQAPGGDSAFGIGRMGTLAHPLDLRELADRITQVLPETIGGVRVAGEPDIRVQKVALLGGAGDSLLAHPLVRSADVYITSDLRHHPALDAHERHRIGQGPALIDVPHWASESLWLDGAAQLWRERLPGVEVRLSELRTEPWTFRV